ncbi:MAG: HEAT repeat domain-containing protein [Planctomycetota bacterium]|jgi:hypothetical protein
MTGFAAPPRGPSACGSPAQADRPAPGGLWLTALAAASLLLAGCPFGGGKQDSTGEPGGRLIPPHERLDRETEEAVMALLEDLRGKDYLTRVKAEEELERRIRKEIDLSIRVGVTPRPMVLPYLLQLLDEPKWDVRAATFRILMKYGFGCPEAVAALVQALGDMNMNARVRDGAARSLALWTGKTFGYNAWASPVEIRSAAKRWDRWLEETGGVIVLRAPSSP